MAKPKCFVAMAFNNDDTDELYERVLKPTIESLGLTARRVDRINRNDDIDDMIFDEIDACNICVSDLTYTRPSVYYEAGYARGKGIPVIHTARADHLDRKAEDDRRIHFDLQMKNIIVWSEVDDERFARVFKERLSVVAKPVFARLKTSQELLEERKRFAASSKVGQAEYLHKILCGHMVSRDYAKQEHYYRQNESYAKQYEGFLHVVRFSTEATRPISDIAMDGLRKNYTDKTTRILYQNVFIQTNTALKKTLANRLPECQVDEKFKRFIKREAFRLGGSETIHKHFRELVVIDSAKSGTEALAMFEEILQTSIDAGLKFLVDLKK